jgi:hypothetical protein
MSSAISLLLRPNTGIALVASNVVGTWVGGREVRLILTPLQISASRVTMSYRRG